MVYEAQFIKTKNKKVKGKLQKDAGLAWDVDFGALTPQVSETLGISGYFSITESSKLVSVIYTAP